MKFILLWVLYSGGHIIEIGKVNNLENVHKCKDFLKGLQAVADFKNHSRSDLPELEMTGTCVEDK